MTVVWVLQCGASCRHLATAKLLGRCTDLSVADLSQAAGGGADSTFMRGIGPARPGGVKPRPTAVAEGGGALALPGPCPAAGLQRRAR